MRASNWPRLATDRKRPLRGVDADVQEVALRGQKPELIDQFRAQVAFMRHRRAGIGSQQPALVPIGYRGGDVVEGQRLKLFDHLRYDVLGGRGRAGHKDQGKRADRVHGASIAAGIRMETKRAIGDSFGDELIGQDASGLAARRNGKDTEMAIRIFTTSAAMLALIAGIGTAAMAQTAAPAPADLPVPLAGLNLGNLEIDTKRDGMRGIEGRTADGIDIEAKVDMAGNLVEVEADNGALPQPLIDALVPAELRGQQVMGLFGSITEVKQRPDHVEIKGGQPSGSEIQAKFDRQNTLIGAGWMMPRSPQNWSTRCCPRPCATMR